MLTCLAILHHIFHRLGTCNRRPATSSLDQPTHLLAGNRCCVPWVMAAKVLHADKDHAENMDMLSRDPQQTLLRIGSPTLTDLTTAAYFGSART